MVFWNLFAGKGWLQSWKDILRYLWISKNAWARLPDTVLRLKESAGQTWSTVIFKSWPEDLPRGKEDEKKQPGQFEKNQNQWEKGIFSRSNWSAVRNHPARSNTGKCPKKNSDPGLFTTLAHHLEEGKQGGLAGYSWGEDGKQRETGSAPENCACADVEGNVALTAGKNRLNGKFCLSLLFFNRESLCTIQWW